MIQQTVIFPGTFDPITYGHLDLVARAAKLFHNVIVAVSSNLRKAARFDLQQRVQLCQVVLQDFPNVTTESFAGLLVDFVQQKNALAVIRGIRAISDFEYEFQLATMNRKLYANFETIFLTPDERFSYLSSSLVREIADLGGDVSAFVPPAVQLALANQVSRYNM